MHEHEQIVKAVGRIVREQDSKFQDQLESLRDEVERRLKSIPEPATFDNVNFEMVDARKRKAVQKLANGAERVLGEWEEPVPVHRGTWESGVSYETADEVAKDGHMWRSLCSNNTDEPGTSARWQMAAQRGKTGKPGIQGDRGEKGEKGDAGKDADPFNTAKFLLMAVNKELEVRYE